jgi:cell surface protein SprA
LTRKGTVSLCVFRAPPCSYPRENYGGIMRSLNSTNFEQGNEYIQLWILDPFVGNGKTAPDNVGKIY